MVKRKTTTKTIPIAGKDAEQTGTLIHCWWEWKIVQPLWKTVW